MALVEAASYFNSFEAGLARSRLEAENIPGILFDSEMSLLGGMGGLIPIRLMVDEEDLEAARRILAEPPQE